MDLKEVAVLGDGIEDHWYYTSKAKAMLSLLDGRLPSSVLDVGAGSGFFSRFLLKNTSASTALCVDSGYVSDSDQTVEGKPIRFRSDVAAFDSDLILLMDVLEHVEDDVSFLRTYFDLAPTGSRFLISVPAFQFLWGPHDIYLEHKRRYRLGQLEAVVKTAGLTVVRGNYYFAFVFPLAAFLRLGSRLLRRNSAPRSQMSQHGFFTNRVLSTLLRQEISFMRHNRLFGLSAFCLAEKR